MRTVTFSDAETARFVNENFVAAWKNRDPGFHNCDFHQEQHILASTPKAFTTRNIATYVLTPDLEVLHYMTGYYHPVPFREELTFGLNLARICFDGEGRLTGLGRERFAAAHAAHRDEHAAKAKNLSLTEEVAVPTGPPSAPAGAVAAMPSLPGLKGIPMAVPVAVAPRVTARAGKGGAALHTPQLQTVLTHGLMSWDMREFHEYLGRVHGHLYGAPRALAEIEADHVIGNNFAEETPETARRHWEEVARKQKEGHQTP